ncbi:MAG: hypothetical protein Q7K30_00055 [Myxosarcina sp. JB018]|nr:hypothetical protein [Myxosarcina sp. JB018]
MLFHYHYWTPYLEETELFYRKLGFRVTQRIGKENGEFQTFSPPLDWNDFRNRKIVFRIIELKKGAINITFGYGKRIRFDHIGFLIGDEEYHQICQQATQQNWNVEEGERRTFLYSPCKWKVELQTNMDAIDDVNGVSIEGMNVVGNNVDILIKILGEKMTPLTIQAGDDFRVEEVRFSTVCPNVILDPNGVNLLGVER